VCYCSEGCQVAGWKSGHSARCGKPSETLNVYMDDNEMKQYGDSGVVEEAGHPGCFDAVDLARRRAYRAGMCSWHKCNRKLDGSIHYDLLSGAMNRCRVSGAVHMTSTAYCCTGHRNRDHVGRIEPRIWKNE
jgi:hypothetical protein